MYHRRVPEAICCVVGRCVFLKSSPDLPSMCTTEPVNLAGLGGGFTQTISRLDVGSLMPFSSLVFWLSRVGTKCNFSSWNRARRNPNDLKKESHFRNAPLAPSRHTYAVFFPKRLGLHQAEMTPTFFGGCEGTCARRPTSQMKSKKWYWGVCDRPIGRYCGAAVTEIFLAQRTIYRDAMGK